MKFYFSKLLCAMAVTVVCLASYGYANQVDKYDNSSHSSEHKTYDSQALGVQYAYDDHGEERRERDSNERIQRNANDCNADWTSCSSNCNQVQDNNQHNLCMVDCNNNLNQCLLGR